MHLQARKSHYYGTGSIPRLVAVAFQYFLLVQLFLARQSLGHAHISPYRLSELYAGLYLCILCFDTHVSFPGLRSIYFAI